MSDPFLVLGAGRSGTSTISRILHNHFGVCMGEHFRTPDDQHPDGYYEDLEFKNPNELFLDGRITLPQFSNIVMREIKKRINKPWWGIKDPRLCYLLGVYLCYLNNPILIRCIRDVNKIADSMEKCYGWVRQDAVKITLVREKYLDRLLKHEKVYTIYFDKQKTDEEIIKELKQISCLKLKIDQI